ncbi:MAG: TniQ family protein [Nostoc sp. TH1S01]|nr:TniQ family protein [Nostoc sp. TH1S01]
MMTNMAVNDELWLKEPEFTPSPSRLFHLEPIGLGTCYVESLTSYVARLAAAHSVLPGTLLAREIKPIVGHNHNTNPLNSKSIVSLYGQASVKALNGTQIGAKQLVFALEILTKRTDLQFLTMLPWAKVIPVLGLLKHSHAWCPYCYQDWLNNQQVIYSPLLWALKPAKICPIHHRFLESKCPHCGLEFLHLWHNSRPGFCPKCDGWLGINYEVSLPDKRLFEEIHNLQPEIWIVKTLGDLIAQAPEFPCPPQRETIKTILRAYVYQYTPGNVSAFGRWLGLSRYEILHWYSGVAIPNLDNLLKICYALSTNLVDFLQLKILPLTLKGLVYLPAPKQKKLSPQPALVTSNSSSKCERVIQAMQLAQQEEPPPSLTQLAVRLGFKTPSSLTACSKSLSASLATRYTEYQQQLRFLHIRNILELALFSDEYPPPSLRKIAKRTGIGLATFYHYCPMVCHAISLRYKDYRKFVHKLTIEQGCREVSQLAPVLHAQGITPTAKNLRKFMHHPSSLWQAEVIDVLRQIRLDLPQ